MEYNVNEMRIFLRIVLLNEGSSGVGRGFPDIFSREVRLQKTSIMSPEFADDFPPGLRVTHPAVMDRGRKNSPILAGS